MHDEFIELLALHALGALDGEDRDRLEAHLATGCVECARELAELEIAGSMLAWAAPPMRPSESLRGRLLESLNGSTVRASAPPSNEPIPFRPRAETSAPRSRTGAAAAAVTLLAAASVAIVFLTTSLLSMRSELESAVRQLANSRSSEQQKDETIREQERKLGTITDPEVRFVALSSAVDVAWNPKERRGMVFARGLPKVAADKAYELWFIAGNTPVPAAVFNTDDAGNAVVEIKELAVSSLPELFAVTVEPAGGSAAPTTKPILAGPYGG